MKTFFQDNCIFLKRPIRLLYTSIFVEMTAIFVRGSHVELRKSGRLHPVNLSPTVNFFFDRIEINRILVVRCGLLQTSKLMFTSISSPFHKNYQPSLKIRSLSNCSWTNVAFTSTVQRRLDSEWHFRYSGPEYFADYFSLGYAQCRTQFGLEICFGGLHRNEKIFQIMCRT